VIRTEELGEDSPEIADLYLAYGKALLENAITQSSVLGKNQPEGDDEAEGSSEPPILLAHTTCPSDE
jgi:HAT1-interacting factor 1